MISRRKFNIGLASSLLTLLCSPFSASYAQPKTATWKRYLIPSYPNGIGGDQYSSKHTRWAWRTVNNSWYVNGGDYSQPGEKPTVYQSGSNNTWRVDLAHNTWEKQHGYWPKEGEIVPSHPDETVFVYDSKRDIFWHGGGYQWQPFSPGKDRANSEVPTALQDRLLWRRWMSFDPKTKRWTDRGALPFEALHKGKFGHYDAVKDWVLIPYYDGSSGAMGRYDCAAGAWLQSIKMSNADLTDMGDSYSAFDTKRRRILFLRNNDFAAFVYDIDSGKFTELPSTNRPARRATNTYGLAYHPTLDQFVMHGGTLSETALVSDLWILPAAGGKWNEVEISGLKPSLNRNQVLLYDPALDGLVSFGGVAGPSDKAYFVVKI